MTLLDELSTLPDAHRLGQIIDLPAAQWFANCHSVSHALVRSGVLDGYGPRPRVARGYCRGVMSQHSWVVLGDGGPYADDTVIIDPTLWTYRGDVDGVYVARVADSPWHRAKGHGLPLLEQGPPEGGDGPAIELRGRAGLSPSARQWLRMIENANGGVLDRKAWMNLAEGTMVGWPAGEVIAAMDATPELTAFVPIDILGMLTDRNPGGLYLADPIRRTFGPPGTGTTKVAPVT